MCNVIASVREFFRHLRHVAELTFQALIWLTQKVAGSGTAKSFKPVSEIEGDAVLSIFYKIESVPASQK